MDRPSDLPTMSAEMARKTYADKAVVILEDHVIEVGAYAEEHPGGEGLLRAYYGARDATASFRKLNNHTAHARSLVEDMRIARVT